MNYPRLHEFPYARSISSIAVVDLSMTLSLSHCICLLSLQQCLEFLATETANVRGVDVLCRYFHLL